MSKLSDTVKFNTLASTPDLMHRDWLLRFVKYLIKKVNPEIVTNIIEDKGSDNKKKVLIAENITETDLLNLQFPTNTDSNNNYLYIEKIGVYLDGDSNMKLLDIDLLPIAEDFWDAESSEAYLNGEKTFKPFNSKLNNIVTKQDGTIIDFIDNYFSHFNKSQNTYGKPKKFKLMVNPDCEQCSYYDVWEEKTICGCKTSIGNCVSCSS